jgi:Flp pilus assembly protein TadD
MSEAQEALHKTAWAHIDAERFAEAELALRELIGLVDPDDHQTLWHLLGLLGSVCNSQQHFDDGTDAYRRSMEAAQRMRPEMSAVGVARYMLANQYLLYGDPRDALETVGPVPAGTGHVQCLLHAVAAEALWKLERKDEARERASDAIDASPTDERRKQLSSQLAHILNAH